MIIGRVQVLRLTGLCSTIQTGEKLFDDLQKLQCSIRIMFDKKLTIIEHKINQTESEK